MLTGWATFPFPSEVQEEFLDNAALDLQDADLKTRSNLSRPAYDLHFVIVQAWNKVILLYIDWKKTKNSIFSNNITLMPGQKI